MSALCKKHTFRLLSDMIDRCAENCAQAREASTMKLPRRKFLYLTAAIGAFPSNLPFAWAQTYPSRPVHIIVGFPPGVHPTSSHAC